ncbi:hypothetical protein WS69_00665 [Burkholderia sp. BDU5]|nr:hypothetical protein WS69_00665 [Burkholderia sp. BDU5]
MPKRVLRAIHCIANATAETMQACPGADRRGAMPSAMAAPDRRFRRATGAALASGIGLRCFDPARGRLLACPLARRFASRHAESHIESQCLAHRASRHRHAGDP